MFDDILGKSRENDSCNGCEDCHCNETKEDVCDDCGCDDCNCEVRDSNIIDPWEPEPSEEIDPCTDDKPEPSEEGECDDCEGCEGC